MQINFQIPAYRQQHENPEIVAAQSAPDSLPLADRKMRRYQISRQVLSPLLINRALRREHAREVSSLDDAHAARPDFVVTITSRLHEQEEGYEHGVDRNDEVRIRR